MVGIEPVGNALPHDLQRHPSRFELDGLEVVEDACADQARGFGVDFFRDRRVKAPLFAGVPGLFASSCASHILLLTSTSSRTTARSRWCSAS